MVYQVTEELIKNEMVIYEGGPYLIENNAFVFEICIREGSYVFQIHDSVGDGISSDGGYSIQIDGKLVKEGGGDNGFQDKEAFSFIIGNEPTKPKSKKKQKKKKNEDKK